MLIKQGKTNVKYLFVVIILAAIVSSSIWLWQEIQKMRLNQKNNDLSVKIDISDWEICHDEKNGYEFKYPDYFNWRVWGHFPYAALASCDEGLTSLFLSENDYDSKISFHIDITPLEQGNAYGDIYWGIESLDDYFYRSNTKLPILKESIIDGERVVWFNNQHGDYRVKIFHNGSFFDFMATDIDSLVFDRIISTIKFIDTGYIYTPNINSDTPNTAAISCENDGGTYIYKKHDERCFNSGPNGKECDAWEHYWNECEIYEPLVLSFEEIQDKKYEFKGEYIEDNELIDEYGVYAFETLEKHPEIVTATKEIVPFDPSTVGTSFLTKVAKLSDGRKFLVMSGCTPHACGGTIKLIIYNPESQEIYILEEDFDVKEILIWGKPNEAELSLLIDSYLNR